MNLRNRIPALVSALLLPMLCVHADERKLPLPFFKSDVEEVLSTYAKRTGRKIWRDLNLWNWTPLTLPLSAAPESVRIALLEGYGIELRDTENNETFATWSDDPKYKEVRDAADRFKMRPRVPPAKRDDEMMVPLQLLGIDVMDLLPLYGLWTGRKIWVTPSLRAKIVLKVKGQIPVSAAVELVRITLLEQCGIELRDAENNETFATWSDDSKCKEVRAAAQAPKVPQPAASIKPGERSRARVIDDPKPPK